MCYDELDYTLESFDGVKVSVKGRLDDELYRIADVYIDDGAGIERLINLLNSERDEWNGFSFGIETVKPIDYVIDESRRSMERHALVGLFLDEFEYECVTEKERVERLQGIGMALNCTSHIFWRYSALVAQVDEELLPEEKREFAKTHPPIIDDNWAEQLRKSIKTK